MTAKIDPLATMNPDEYRAIRRQLAQDGLSAPVGTSQELAANERATELLGRLR